MPGRSKRSKAAGQREQTKTEPDIEIPPSSIYENSSAHHIQSIPKWMVVSGTLH